ncbi:MAG: hypothetical protein CM1200mP28_10570 [Deltaproteobacteria bacterium]|nr:MAG: hypothetical protein CM1200mP28_10570 [Deltaproteobacteria bacterium]
MNINNNFQISSTKIITPFWIGSIVSGILLGLNAPGFGTHWIGLVSFFPLLFTLEQLHKKTYITFRKRCIVFSGICWITGGIASLIGGYWITNSIHVFGHIPFIFSLLITGAGYGLEVGLQLFVYFAIPLLCFKKLGNWELTLRLAYVIAIDPWYPRLIHWNYGGLTFSQFPFLEQVADIIGSSGLIFYSLGLSFLLIAWWRLKSDVKNLNDNEMGYKFLKRAIVAYSLLWAMGLSYGAWRILDINENDNLQNSDSFINVIAIQPNFSLQDLASNPELAHSKRQGNLDSLLEDSKKYLSKLSKQTDEPTLIVWPESVFPHPFFKVKGARQKVMRFAEENNTSVLFTSVDWKKTMTGRKFYGVSVLVGSNGEVLGRYNKIFLIPFGEMIPFSNIFPETASWLRNNIANMSEFDPGQDYEVFSLSEKVRLSAPICFDVFSKEVVRRMSLNGANLVVNLSNLAWFGRTTASDNMVAVLRWRPNRKQSPCYLCIKQWRKCFHRGRRKKPEQSIGAF